MLQISIAATLSYAGTPGHWGPSVLKVDSRCPMFIEEGCDATDMHGGLGHRFLALNSLIATASALRLTLRIRFGSAGHFKEADQRKSMTHRLLISQSYFFGDTLFAPLPNGSVLYMSVNSSKALREAVAQARRHYCPSRAGRQAAKPVAVVFNLSVCSISFGSDSHNLDVSSFRRVFHANAEQRARVATRHLGVSLSAPHTHVSHTGECTAAAGAAKSPRIGVHIRRGDVLDCSFGDRNYSRVPDRGVANEAYVGLLQELTIQLGGKASVLLAAEGATDSTAIPNVDGSTTNFQQHLPGTQVTAVPTDVEHAELVAFQALCFSDVLITGKSGFSFMVAVLCKRPVILAIPFWIPYRVVPNARAVAAVGSKDYTLQCIASKAAIAGGKGKGSRMVSLHDRFALQSTHTDMLSKACLLARHIAGGEGAPEAAVGRRLAVATGQTGVSAPQHSHARAENSSKRRIQSPKGKTTVRHARGSTKVAVCVVGAPRSFVRVYAHGSILNALGSSGVHVDFFFWLAREDMSNSKGGIYDAYTASNLRGAVDRFAPKLAVFNGSTMFKRNAQCSLADETQEHRLHDRTNQTTLARMWETMAVHCPARLPMGARTARGSSCLLLTLCLPVNRRSSRNALPASNERS